MPTTLVLLLLAALAAPAAPPPRPDSRAIWRVEDAHGPTRSVRFTTDEGTWLSLDVSPDGKTVVFSLLGDLYLVPLSGGAARRLTGGPAYDVQPRFSPDGQQVAFASDRGGGENLWVTDLGGRRRAVTAEAQATVNGPEWTPDGEWLVGRKRFTDLSSIGTSELWMWSVRGGEGFPLTHREDQAEAADPCVSRDGRYLFFSARAGRFEYNLDVNDGIWQVKRLDRRSGQATPVTAEFGGAAAPRVSPDGRTLAYARRVRGRTRLELLDLASGRSRLLADGVERDLQEAMATHGVFPGYAFTPDGREVVGTAEGRIWRWDVASGARAAVPFTADVEQAVAEAVRFPHPLGSDSVRARVLSSPAESPDGRTLVFSALGRLWSMDLPRSRPRRVTAGSDLEYAPAFSPDGRRLAYSTWNDAEGGHIWLLDHGVTGVEPKRLTTVPGLYQNLAFSRDGSKLAFVRGSGAVFRGRDLVEEPWHELGWVSVHGGDPQAILFVKNHGENRRLTRPVFSTDAQRVYFADDEPAAKPTDPATTVLVSVALDGTDRRTHLRLGTAEEVVPSPDGRWVAFAERSDAWLTPLPMASTAVEAALEKGALPVARLTREGGEWLGWADGGRTVTWMAGPVYARLSVDRALPVPAPESPPPPRKEAGKRPDAAKPPAAGEPRPDTFEITLEVRRPRPEGVVAYRGARLITMQGDEVVEEGTLVVEGERIRAVGPSATVAVPAGAREVDVRGRTIVPGLVDAHAHLHYSAIDELPQESWKYRANLAYGVTTAHDPSATTAEAFAGAERVRAGLMTGPRVFSTGYPLYGAEGPGQAVIRSLDDARQHLRRLKAMGAFSVKSYMQPRREQRQWIIQAAREERMLVVPEGGGDLETDVTLILDGHTTLEHSIPVTPLRQDVIRLLAASGTAYTPTLLVAFGGLEGDFWFHQETDLWKDERLTRVVPPAMLDPLVRIRERMATDPADWHHLAVSASARAILEAGGRVLLGAHGQMQGLGAHWELRALAQGGMTPLQALRCATLAGAQALGLDADLGSLAPGKLADFVVLEKDPREDIRNSQTVALVVKGGQAYRPRDLALRE